MLPLFEAASHVDGVVRACLNAEAAAQAAPNVYVEDINDVVLAIQPVLTIAHDPSRALVFRMGSVVRALPTIAWAIYPHVLKHLQAARRSST